MTPLTEKQRLIAIDLYEVHAVAFGPQRLPIFERINLRTVDNPNKGPITSEIVRQIGFELRDESLRSNFMPSSVCGVPFTDIPYAEALTRAFELSELRNIRLSKHAAPKRTMSIASCYSKANSDVCVVNTAIGDTDDTFETIRTLQRSGFIVRDVVGLVDLEIGGREKLEDAGYLVHVPFTFTELLDFYVGKEMLRIEMRDKTLAALHQTF